jgi:hypothetical protein
MLQLVGIRGSDYTITGFLPEHYDDSGAFRITWGVMEVSVLVLIYRQ